MNAGTYRNQLHDKNLLDSMSLPVITAGYIGTSISAEDRLARLRLYLVAIRFFYGGMTELPWGVCEIWVGGWRNEPM